MIYAPPQIPSYAQGFAARDGPPANPNLRKGLVGEWHPYLGPTGLMLFDQNGWHNDGTLVGPTWVASPMGWALKFDGTNDCVLLGNRDSLKPAKLTVAAWVWLDSTHGDDWPKIIDWEDDTKGYQFFYSQTAAPNDGYAFSVGTGAGVTVVYSHITTKDRWYFVLGTYDGDKPRIYVNGLCMGVGDAGAISYAGLSDLRIGTRGADARHWKGPIASVAIWSRVLAPSEIQDLYAKPHALTRLERRVFVAAVAAGGVAPTSHLYGPLVGPLGGAV